MLAGAYGFSMSSNYNARLRPAEVLLTLNNELQLIRERYYLEDLSTPDLLIGTNYGRFEQHLQKKRLSRSMAKFSMSLTPSYSAGHN